MCTLQHRVLAAVAAVAFLASVPIQGLRAQEAAPSGTTSPEVGAEATAHSMDLGSRRPHEIPTDFQHFESAQIEAGRQLRTVTPSDLLTSAELAALRQVLTTGEQTLRIGRHGNAVGGTVDLTAELQTAVQNLVVPSRVTAVHDFAGSAVNLSGNFSNAGKFYAISSNGQTTAASITADNIHNQAGGLLYSALPTGELTGFTNAAPHLDLNLFAVNDILNDGAIRSSGNLAMTAGGSIVNQGAASAAQHVSLNSALGNIVNSGLISAASGNLNIATQGTQNLIVNNIGGTMQALQGAINVREALTADKVNTSLSGGRFLSKELNLLSGDGTARINADEVLGRTNISAGIAHVMVDSDFLNLGTMNLTGDPTFFNRGGAVSLSATSVSTSGNALAIVAKTDVSIHNTAITTGGGSILIIAGATFDGGGTDAQVNNDTGTTIEIRFTPGGGANGAGNINITGTSSISSNATTAGNISLMAFGGGVAGSGNITMDSTTSITANGSGAGTDGIVTVTADGTSTGIQLSSISATGGSGGGNITIQSAAPAITTASSTGCGTPGCVRILDGAILLGGAFGAGAQSAGHILFRGNVIAAGNLTVTTGGSGDVLRAPEFLGGLSATNVSFSSGTGDIGTQADPLIIAPDNLTLTTGGTGSVFVIEANGDFNLNASSAGDKFTLSSPGGMDIVGAVTAPNVFLRAQTDGDISLAANVGNVGGTTTLVTLDGGIVCNPCTVRGATIVLSSGTGSIGTGTHPVQTTATNLTLKTGGTGSVFVDQTGAVTLADSSAGADFELATDSATTLNDIVADSGSLTVANNTGLLQVMQNAHLSAGGGNLTLQNLDTVDGDITLGIDSILTAGGTTSTPGNVFVVVGDTIPLSPVVGVVPANVSASVANGGKIFYSAGITANELTNTVFANRGRVVFDRTPGASITLAGGVRIGAGGGPLLRNLDLRDSAVTSFILAQQAAKNFGGKLKVDSNGAAIGGKLILNPFNLAPMLSAQFIPVKVTLQLKDFNPNQSLSVQVTQVINPVVINGKQDFVGKTQGGAFIIDSTVPTSVLLGATGSLKSKTGYTINVDGSIILAGKIQAKNLTITTIEGSNGSVDIQNSIGKSSVATTIDVDGFGEIRQSSTSPPILGSTITLKGETGSIGTATDHIRTKTATLSANTGGFGVFVDNSGNLTLQNSTSGRDFRVSTTGSFNVSDISADDGFIELVATGSGTLMVSQDSLLEANGLGANLTIQHVKASSKAIFIDTGSTLKANASNPGSGNVTIFVGATAPTPENATDPVSVDAQRLNGGHIFYGANSILANGPPGSNSITADNAIVSFSTGTSKNTAITLNGGVVITADPPVSPGAPLTIPGSSGLDPAAHAGQGAHEQPLQTGRHLNVMTLHDAPTGQETHELPVQTGPALNTLLPHPVPDVPQKDMMEIAYRPGAVPTQEKAFFCATSAMTVTTAHGVVHAKKNSFFSVDSSEACTRIQSFNGTGSVCFLTEGHRASVHQGGEIMVTNHEPTPDQLRPSDGVGRSHARTSVCGRLHVTLSDISIVSVMNNSGHLQALRKSSSTADRNLISHLERLAAALHMVTQARGAYTAYPKQSAPAPVAPFTQTADKEGKNQISQAF